MVWMVCKALGQLQKRVNWSYCCRKREGEGKAATPHVCTNLHQRTVLCCTYCDEGTDRLAVRKQQEKCKHHHFTWKWVSCYFSHRLCLVAHPHLQHRKLGKYTISVTGCVCETFSGVQSKSQDSPSKYICSTSLCPCTVYSILPDSSTLSMTTHKCSGLILLHVKHKGT